MLYFATHGGPDQVWLRPDDEVVGATTLKEWLGEEGCEGRHIHFGGCNTFRTFKECGYNLENLMKFTKATSVSGYAAESGWLGQDAPALPLELQLFGLLADVNIARNTKDRSKKLRGIKDEIIDRFPDCQFNMLVRRYKRS